LAAWAAPLFDITVDLAVRRRRSAAPEKSPVSSERHGQPPTEGDARSGGHTPPGATLNGDMRLVDLPRRISYAGGVPVNWDDETRFTSRENVEKEAGDERDRAYLIVLAGSSVGEMFILNTSRTVIGRGNQADIHIIDEGISRRHAEVMQEGDRVFVRDLGSTNGTFLNGHRINEHPLKDGDKIQVGSTTILKFTFHDSLDESFQRQMYESALRDGLTKAFNKKYFLERLDSEFAYSIRHKSPLSLIMLDIDHFKSINDSYGHLAGDYALATMAGVVASGTRQEDVFARYGGEEFGIICRGIDLEGAVVFAERIRQMVAAASFVYGQTQLNVKISVGVATVPETGMREYTELIACADEALYAAKRGGRNRVVAANSLSKP
jgi:diguanylate cyclase (GGDEF)-like protein